MARRIPYDSTTFSPVFFAFVSKIILLEGTPNPIATAENISASVFVHLPKTKTYIDD